MGINILYRSETDLKQNHKTESIPKIITTPGASRLRHSHMSYLSYGLSTGSEYEENFFPVIASWEKDRGSYSPPDSGIVIYHLILLSGLIMQISPHIRDSIQMFST